jgi:hypothetical protein
MNKPKRTFVLFETQTIVLDPEDETHSVASMLHYKYVPRPEDYVFLDDTLNNLIKLSSVEPSKRLDEAMRITYEFSERSKIGFALTDEAISFYISCAALRTRTMILSVPSPDVSRMAFDLACCISIVDDFIRSLPAATEETSRNNIPSV